MKRPVARKARKTPIKTAAKTSAKTAAQTSAKIPAKTPVKINPAISAEAIPDDGKKPSAAAKAVAPAQNTEPVVAAVSGEMKSKNEPKDQSREKPRAKSKRGAGNETKAGDKDDVKDTDKDETRDKSKHAPLEEELENPKLVHGIFVMSKKEYKALRKLKKDCKKAGVKVKKSELLRAGMTLLNKQAPEEIQALISGLAPLKAGRLNKVK